MSNPFLDPEPSAQDSEAAAQNFQSQNGSGSPAISLSKTNPFYEDLLGSQTGDQSSVETSNTASSTLIDFTSESGDASKESGGVDATDILLDLGEDGAGGGAHTTQTNSGGGGDGSTTGTYFEHQDFSIPPPMEFSDGPGSLIGDVTDSGHDVGGGGGGGATVDSQNPVTNIDDLLGMDFSDASMSASAPVAAPVTANGASESSDESFDFLLDEEEAREVAEPLADIQEEDGPPSVPVATFPGAMPEAAPEVSAGEETTSLFLPSENPADNVTLVSVSSEPSTDGDGDAQDKTVYKTDITVTSPKSASVTAVSVTTPKPAPRSAAGRSREKCEPGPSVVKVDSGAPPPATQIQFDTSVSQPVANISVPPGAVKLTTQGITKDPKSDPSTQDDGEEEEIKPMMVHRDHQGNKLATPSPPETLGRQTMEPRRLDESAKRDLQSIMSEMNKNVRGVPVVKNGVANGDFSDSVQEDEIVPVKLTRKEAETAEKVLSNWVSGEKKSPASPSSSPKKSAFQKAVGTMIDVQSGKKELPADSVFFTTIGITKAPKDKQNGQVEEEEEIKPMTLHKDHLGNKYFAPSPPESLGKQSGIRKLDEAVKQDIAAVMSSMSAKPTQSSPSRVSQGKDKDVEEDSIVPTVLSREDARTAMSVLAKWATGESAPKSTPSSFQRLVGNVLDSKASDDTAPGKTVHASLVNVVKESEDSAPAPPHVAQDKADDDQRSSVPELKKEETVKATLVMLDTSPDPTKTDDASSEPAKDTEAPASAAQADASPSKQTPAEEFQKSKPPPPEVKPKPTPPLEVKSKLGLSERRSLFEPDQKSSAASFQAKPLTNQSETAKSTSAVESRPVPIQRGLRAPVRLSSGPGSTLGTKPLSKIGGLSMTNRNTSSLLSSSKAAKPEYAKSRTEDAPFLVEVLKGIVGLGIKVVVTPDGHVQVTEVQRNSPVDKNGNVKVGDYLVCVNTTELTGLTDGRVQQVLRLLPRGLVKLVVSTQPPGPTQEKGGEAGSPLSPRPGGAYSQYGVRLSPLPFSPTPSDGQPSSLTSPSTPPVAEVPASETSAVEPLSVSVDSEEDSDMSTRKLSKALSPRSHAVQNYSPEPPKPAPRQRANVPTSLSQPSDDGESDPGQISPRKAERKMTANEIVAAASRRPSGTSPPDTSLASPRHKGEVVEEQSSPAASSPRSVSSVDPVVEAARHPSGVSSPRDEALPVFTETAKKAPPTPTPRPKPRSSSHDEVQDGPDGKTPSPAINNKEISDSVKAEPPADDVKPESVPQTQTTSPSAKIPPPVAPKPKRTSSVGSDRSASSAHSEDTPKDLPSPTMVSPKLRDFADASAPSVEEQQQSRKRVTSAARMFEKKAEESAKPVAAQNQPKTSKSVSSVIRSFNREPEPEPAKSTVTMRKVSLGVGSDSGKPINSALLPPSERRRSMPNPVGTSSFSLTKPNSLSQFRNPPSSRASETKKAEDAEAEKPSRINSALMPKRSQYSNTTSLKSVSALRDSREDRHVMSPPAVGKDGDSKHSFSKFDTSTKSLTSPSSLHDGTSPHSRHAWSSSSSSEKGSDDTHSPKMIFTSSSLHHTDRYRTSEDPRDPHLESTMKKFDDLLSDKHTFDSDDELPKVSNSVSLDLLKSRNANRVAASMKSNDKEEPAAEVTPQEPARPEAPSEELTERPTETKGTRDAAEAEADAVAEKTEPKTEPEPEAVKQEVSETIENIEVEAVESTPPKTDQSEKVHEDNQESKEHEVVEEVVESAAKEQQAAPATSKQEEEEERPSAVSPEEIQKPEPESEPSPVDKSEEASTDVSKPVNAEPETPVSESKDDEDTASQDPAKPEQESEESGACSQAAEMIYRQQASSIVDTVLSRALQVVSQPQPREEEEEEDADERSTASPSPPPLPDEEPPPLPGAPPPPLILRNEADRLVDAADLVGLTPSQEVEDETTVVNRSSDSADIQAEEETCKVLESSDVELEIDETVKPESVQQSFTVPSQPEPQRGDVAEEQQKAEESQNTETQRVPASDVLISFDTAPSDAKPPTLLTDLPVSVDSVHHGHEKDLEHLDHSENPPVSDTLSQDSGVQDEDMSEDGLRFSQDDSPTSNVDSSVFDAALSPEDENVSVTRAVSPPQGQVSESHVAKTNTEEQHANGLVPAESQKDETETGSENKTPFTYPHLSSVPVMSDITESTYTLSRGTFHPYDSVTFSSQDKSLSSTPHITMVGAHGKPVSELQDSSSPKCSSAPQEEEEEEEGESPGGVSTTGSAAETEGVEERNSEANVSQENVEQKVGSDGSKDVVNSEEGGKTDSVREKEETTVEKESQSTSVSSPPEVMNETHVDTSNVDKMASIPENSAAQDSAEVVSSRKWCILDQSGSLFLHGASKSTVTVPAQTLRQVASMSPSELAAMIAVGNKELDEAKASQNVELRVVGARGLDGVALEVDVFQRQDYLVQVTQVLTKNSPVEEADLLLSVDGRSLKNRRPAQVHTQLDNTGPKGIVLTARGVKLPASVIRHEEISKAAKSAAAPPSQPAPPPPTSPSRDAAPTPAVSLGGGVYEVVMMKGATGVGFCLEGGKASPKGDLPILIKRIFKGGPAEKCGQLKVKDEILAVNDVDFTNMRHYEAWNHLKFLDDGEIRLKIRRTSED